MVGVERRKYARRKIKIESIVYEKGRKIPATIIDIGLGGLGLLSQEAITPGSKIEIVLSHTDEYAIGGTVHWAMLICKDKLKGEFQYRMGIKADEVLDPVDIINSDIF